MRSLVSLPWPRSTTSAGTPSALPCNACATKGSSSPAVVVDLGWLRRRRSPSRWERCTRCSPPWSPPDCPDERHPCSRHHHRSRGRRPARARRRAHRCSTSSGCAWQAASRSLSTPSGCRQAWAEPLLDSDFTHTALYDELASRTGIRIEDGHEHIRADHPHDDPAPTPPHQRRDGCPGDRPSRTCGRGPSGVPTHGHPWRPVHPAGGVLSGPGLRPRRAVRLRNRGQSRCLGEPGWRGLSSSAVGHLPGCRRQGVVNG